MDSTDPTEASRSGADGRQIEEIARGGGLAFAGLIGTAVLQYGYNVGVARYFGATALGLFTFAFSIVSVAATLGQGGFRETLIRFVATYRAEGRGDRLRGILTFALLFGLVGATLLALVVYLLAEPISLASKKPGLAPVLETCALAIPLIAVLTLVAGALQGARRLGRSSLVREIGRPSSVLLAVVACFTLALPFSNFLWLFVACLTVSVGLGLVLLWRTFRGEFGDAASVFEAGKWLRFSLPVTLIDLFRATSSWLDTILLGFLAVAADMAVYYTALRTAILLTLVLAALNAILTPLVADLWTRRDLPGLGRVFRTTTRWTWSLTIPVAVVLFLARRPLMGIFGAEFIETGALVLAIILAGRLGNTLTGGVGQILLMTGHQRIEVANTLVTAGLMIGGMFLVVPRQGIVGAAIVNSAIVAGMNLVKLVEVRLLVGIQPYDRSYLKLIGAAAVAGTVGWSLSWAGETWPPLVQVLTLTVGVGTSYTAVLLAFGLDEDDRGLLRSLAIRKPALTERGRNDV